MDKPVLSLRDEDDALTLLPSIGSITVAEADALGCYWASTEGNPEFEAIPVVDRKPDVFAVVKDWEGTGFASSYIILTMVREIDHFLREVSGTVKAGEETVLTSASEEHGRDMLKVFSYLVSVGEYTKDDANLDWLFDALSEVLKAESLRLHGDAAIPVGLKTIGDVRRMAALVVYCADVFEVTDYDEHPCVEIEDGTGMRIKNPVIRTYLEEHLESAHLLAEYVVERGIGSTVEEGQHVIEWYEGIASSLKSGAL